MRGLGIDKEARKRILSALNRVVHAPDKAAFEKEEAAFLARQEVARHAGLVAYYTVNWKPIAER